ncbi:MAG: hypothetical protein A2992_02190 [Elusimicrobia bacterium RIFCSPLOWO2_01_FULL_59_12]|nr:MAG: hypothetical protein A2992_02190 [Elusimicrobia bacterium RIFCSPLOWO2_01_FULL_59_12]
MMGVILRGPSTCYSGVEAAMAYPCRTKPVVSPDFEAFASEVAAAVWNQLIEIPAFSALRCSDYASVFEAVAGTLSNYKMPLSRNKNAAHTLKRSPS